MYRTYVYQCWGSRSRPRYTGTAHSSALGEERVGVIGPSLECYIIPDTVAATIQEREVPARYFSLKSGLLLYRFRYVIGEYSLIT